MTEVWLAAVAAGVLGFLLGSFLNVVIYRLPKMLERQWAEECAQASTGSAPPVDTAPAFNLLVPRSACRQCGHQIRWYENIPLVSYLFLRGRCSSCGSPIGLRYPAVELCAGLLAGWCVWHWGVTPTAAAWAFFSLALLTLALIDWDTTLLPDDITLPLLWVGLIAAAQRWIATPLESALWGAVVGYLSLWSIYWLFKLATGKEGMGYGDFKLFAALGAWFGWQSLVPIILLASVIGAVVGIALKFAHQLREGGYVPFGPFLAGAGFAALFLGPQRLAQLLSP
jgi:leader peptidase (prepilin peptidase)/N-methyltransferase